MTSVKEISQAEYKRMSYEEQRTYLRSLYDDEGSDSENEGENVSEHLDETESENHLCPSTLPNIGENDEASDVEDVYADTSVSIHLDSEYEGESDEDFTVDEFVPNPASSVFLAKDHTKWKTQPSTANQTRRHNILRQRSGPVKFTETLSVRELFKHIFTNCICDIIIRETNRKTKMVYQQFNSKHRDRYPWIWKEFTLEELHGFLGILITAGVYNSSSVHVKELWTCDEHPLYRATMSRDRFCEITRFLRFDNNNTRSERLISDNAAAISDIWLMLNENLRKAYVPSENLVIDEQLFPYRGRTRFTQYMPSKPAKYGIKIWWICDAANAYPLTGQIYTGKPTTGREKNQGERIVQDLAVRYRKSGRNITMDNFFMTLPVARLLMSWELSVVGTLKKNKTYIPLEMLATKNREPLSSIFGFSEDNKITICSYVPKKNRNVIMLSTLHSDNSVSGPKCKPEIIHFYNKTKGGVDTMDKMLKGYSTKRKTLRWPMAIFYNMLDVSSLASYLIYKINNPSFAKRSNSRRKFLQDLGRSLAMPSIKTRSQNPNITKHFSTKLAIESVLGHSITPNQSASTSERAKNIGSCKPVVGSCYLCRTMAHKQRKTRKNCCVCYRPICDEHTQTISKCYNCSL